jgi:hypothetical protein
MRPALLIVTAALLAAACATPAVASARLWHAHTLGTREQTFLRGLDALPDGRIVLLDQRRHAGTNRLELRIGSAYRVLATGRHNFDDVFVGHDNSSRVTVTWAQVPDAGAARRAFVWTAETGAQQVSTVAGRSASVMDLGVASDGGAAVSIFQGAAAYVARRAPGAARFAVAEQIFATPGAFPRVGVGPGGLVTVVTTGDGSVRVRRAAGGGAFGPEIRAPLPPAPAGDVAEPRVLDLGARPDGSVVGALSVLIRPHGGGETALNGVRVDGFSWAAGTPSPTLPRTLSFAAFASDPAVAAWGDGAFVAWGETAARDRAPRALRTVRWPGDAASPIGTYRAARPVSALFERVALQPLVGQAVRVYYGANARIYTVWLDQDGRPHGAASIALLRGGSGLDVHAVHARSGSMIAYTTGSPYRVVTARP